MADYQLIIIGGGLSGIAAGIRSARFGLKTLLLEQHTIPGGLNSYYYRQGQMLETGLHAMTNYAQPGDKRAPLNRLFRQLKLSRKQFTTHEQYCSEIRFPDASLRFSNQPLLLEEEIRTSFPAAVDRFSRLKELVAAYDPFTPAPWRSARNFLAETLGEPLLEEMLLLPLMVYGNAEEHDMDLGQFVIMFRSIFMEGFFRPAGTIREFLSLLTNQYREFGGELRYRALVSEIVRSGDRIQGVRLAGGELISADAVLSTVGMPGTIALTGWDLPAKAYGGQMSFMETVSLVPWEVAAAIEPRRTILFYNTRPTLCYQRTDSFLDLSWGVICFPSNFVGVEAEPYAQIRNTNAANYALWKAAAPEEYRELKAAWTRAAVDNAGTVIGAYRQEVVYQDSFTPLTIERYTRKAEGAIYGSPLKIKDGTTPWPNLFIAGTDQGYLGIVGAMLSGVTVVNQHLLQ
ncbi:phytoene desaturase family protein [Desulfogranum mediterraneum]|uniref:phytoene desaturase family protein n=1 Tax=Desulfogranum mediterraneum TaxID=160661 RepID=UPI00040DA6BD|nr:FAD-dependent oxidoreductase [Desulfogranum mediterraneum]